MKVEIISVGTELLASEQLDVNAAHVSRSLQEVNLNLICRVTVGEDVDMITDVLRVSLKRADVVLTIGGMGRPASILLSAVSRITGRRKTDEKPWLDGATLIGQNQNGQPFGFLLQVASGTLICLPDRRRDLAYLMENEVLPFLRRQPTTENVSRWILLRTAGVMESSLRRRLAELKLDVRERITYASYAGQTDIRLWVEDVSQERAEARLRGLVKQVYALLGNQIFGEGDARLEDVLLRDLSRQKVSLVVAECYDTRTITDAWRLDDAAADVVTLLSPTVNSEVKRDLDLAKGEVGADLTRLCRTVADDLREQTGCSLSLAIYQNILPGGIQILVTLASEFGVTAMQRSFGGRPENIDEWAATLGLIHVRRWLLAHAR